MTDLRPELEAGVPVAAGPRMKWVKAGLSLFLVFHLFCVLLVPNSDNYVGNYFSKIMLPYLYFFELTNNWNFFSPNPEPPVYVEFELVDTQGQAFLSGQWPDARDSFFWRDRKTRRVSAADFMVNQELRAEKIMVSYLCHRDPRTHSIRIWRAMDTIPTPEEVVSGKRRIGDGVGTERKFVSHTFCNQAEVM